MMISVDFSAIADLKENMKKAATDSDETLALLERIFAEMQNDFELQTYIQAESAQEEILEAINNMTRVNECICRLKDILLSVDEEYGYVEHENINKIEQIQLIRRCTE